VHVQEDQEGGRGALHRIQQAVQRCATTQQRPSRVIPLTQHILGGMIMIQCYKAQKAHARAALRVTRLGGGIHHTRL
jgi:hypothetical protein